MYMIKEKLTITNAAQYYIKHLQFYMHTIFDHNHGVVVRLAKWIRLRQMEH